MQASKEFEEKVKYARTYLLLLYPFFGTLVINIEVLETSGPGATAWTDGKVVKFNSDYAKSIPREQFVAVLVHQILHTALQHKKRGLTAENRRAWNMACDEVANQIISLNSSKMTEKIQMPSYMKTQARFKDFSAEQIYDVLKKEVTDYSSEHSQNGQDLDFDLFVETARLEDFDYAELNNLLVRAENNSKMQGKTPLGIGREFDTLLHPKIDWRIMLKEFVQSFPSDWDYANRDRRFMNSPFYMPSLNGDQVKIAIAIDTSGSISHNEISQFMTEAYSILSAYSRVEIIMMCCDADVHGVKKVTNLQEATSFEIKGGGGTDFRPVFQELQTHQLDFNALIYFTDGYGTFPSQADYGIFKTLWIMTSDVKAPFGNTIKY